MLLIRLHDIDGFGDDAGAALFPGQRRAAALIPEMPLRIHEPILNGRPADIDHYDVMHRFCLQ